MVYQNVFKRFELKYILTREQKARILEAMGNYMEPDRYGRTTIRNLYFDTENYRLIRHSIEKPAFKEKMRIRSYKKATPKTEVFVELKRKYDSLVYKRRLALAEKEAMEWVCGGHCSQEEGQLVKEIDYFMDYYKTLRPVVFLSYDREAYYSKDGDDFRVTFDDHILCREEELSLEAKVWGHPVLEEGKVLMEIKTSGGIPLWMTAVLSKEKIYKTSFSKYGTAYQKMIYPALYRKS